jgi:ABC-type polysaccharide/polyol phosphate transport system ATPase subunit
VTAAAATPNAIELTGVGKRYSQSIHAGDLLLKRLVKPWTWAHQRSETWALRDLDLQIRRGETVGIIGRNGSGKTTLLRLLSGVSAPTSGRLRVAGSVAPLIGVGVGFHPELTGRENVFVNGRLLGLTEAELRRRFADIVDFSEIGEAIDVPVKYYSSGMFLRLGFAVAIHTDPQILLVDEILAVGDIAFQLKCMERMRAVQAAGTTIVVVTHNLHSLDQMAPRTVVLSRGRKVFDGPTEDALATFHAVMQDEAATQPELDHQLQEGTSFIGGAQLDVRLLDGAGCVAQSFVTGERMTLHVEAGFDRPVEDPLLGLLVMPIGGTAPAYWTHTFPRSDGESSIGTYGPGRPLVVDIDLAMRLLAGGYTVSVGVRSPGGDLVLAETPPLPFYVTSPGTTAGGVADLDARVRVAGRELTAPALRRLDRVG